jgi:hypothetical protein
MPSKDGRPHPYQGSNKRSGDRNLAVDLLIDVPLVTVGDRRGLLPCAPAVPPEPLETRAAAYPRGWEATSKVLLTSSR